uniref:Uncharacterized protein n=1 Tax=Timema shepardi TaxID=629360 RepID=A0A7R9AZ66_TIMSH|nr:unnamed protein product [Timema shepardi]
MRIIFEQAQTLADPHRKVHSIYRESGCISKLESPTITVPYESPPRVEVVEYGAPCSCARGIVHGAIITRRGHAVALRESEAKPYPFTERRIETLYVISLPYSVEVPKRPPPPKRYEYAYQVLVPEVPIPERPCQAYGYTVEIPAPTKRERYLSGLVAHVDKVLVPRAPCETSYDYDSNVESTTIGELGLFGSGDERCAEQREYIEDRDYGCSGGCKGSIIYGDQGGYRSGYSRSSGFGVSGSISGDFVSHGSKFGDISHGGQNYE